METKTCDICGKDKSMSEFVDSEIFVESNTDKQVNICNGCK